MPAIARREPVLLLVLAAGVLTTGMNITALGPLLRPIGAEFGLSTGIVGQLSALHALVAGLAAILVAPWVDRFPRRAVLRAECAVVVLATLVSALAPSYAWLAAGRALAGLGGAIIGATCFACASDFFPDPGRRNRAIGILGATFSVATIVGLPVVTQVASAAGWRPALAILLLPAALATLGTALLPTAVPSVAGADAAAGTARVRAVLGSGRVNWLLVGLLLFCLPYAGWTIYFAAFAQATFAAGADALSVLFALGGAGTLLGSVALPALLRRASAARVYGATALLVGGCLVGVYALRGPWPVLAPFAIVVGSGTSVLYLLSTILLLEAMPRARGAVLALQTGTFELGWAIGAAATGGLLFLAVDYATVYALSGLPLLLSLACLRLSGRCAPPAAAPDGGRGGVMIAATPAVAPTR